MKDIYIERPELGGKSTIAQFGWQQMQRLAQRTELLDEQGQWLSSVPKKPEGRRLVFESPQAKIKALDVYAAWQNLFKEQINEPVLPEKNFTRLAQSRNLGEAVTLFIPWGVRPQGEIGPELQALDRIQAVQKLLSDKNIQSKVLIMPADVYATDVNGIDKKKTEEYFNQITEEGKQRGLMVKPWSEIRATNRARYNEIARDLTEKKLEEIMRKDGTLERVFKAARRRSENGDPRKAAFDYLRERICEAIIIEEAYKPIKVSLAPKNKDNLVDVDLPRLYVIPSELQLPWLQ